MQYRCNTNHKSIRFSRKGTQLEQLFQGSFWKNRNFFKGVFIKDNPKRQEAKKASHFFDTRTLFLGNLMCDCRFAIRIQFLQLPFYANKLVYSVTWSAN